MLGKVGSGFSFGFGGGAKCNAGFSGAKNLPHCSNNLNISEAQMNLSYSIARDIEQRKKDKARLNKLA